MTRTVSRFGERGTKLVASILKTYDLGDGELELLELAGHQSDDIAALEALLVSEGPTVVGSTGQPRLNPIYGELRQQRASLSKMLVALSLPGVDEGDEPLTPAQRKARRAANTRWQRERARLEARDGAAS